MDNCNRKLTDKIMEFQKRLAWIDDVSKRDRTELARERETHEAELTTLLKKQ